MFHRCRLTGECEAGAGSLGRPWRAFASTLFLACDMDEHVNPAGFEDWQNWDGVRPITRRCGEWGTTGVRADLSTRLSSVNVPRHASLLRLAGTNSSFAICATYFVAVPKVTPGEVLDGWVPF